MPPASPWRRWFATAAAVLALAPAWAAYPERPLTLVAPYPAGGAADVVARLLAKRLEDPLGKPVIVDNRPGAGTAIGAALVANAKPDGYTLLVSSNSTFTLNPAAGAKTSYDPAKSFEAIGTIGSIPLMLVAHPAAPFSSVKDLVAYAKAHPGELNYVSQGVGTPAHVFGQVFARQAGIDIPFSANTAYVNTIAPGQQTPSPQ